MIIIKSQIELSSREETDHRAQAKELKINRLAQRPAGLLVLVVGLRPCSVHQKRSAHSHGWQSQR